MMKKRQLILVHKHKHMGNFIPLTLTQNTLVHKAHMPIHTCTKTDIQAHIHTVVVGSLCAVGRAAQPSLVADRHVSLLSQFL